MAFVIPEPSRPTLPVIGSGDAFPVRRVFCIGRNYADHAREMGHDPDREPPFFFQKAPECLLVDGGQGTEFPYPSQTSDVHHEIELVAALGQGGTDIGEEHALACVWGYGTALDMTRRDLQGEAKKMGRPWDTGKSFDHAAPCSGLRPASETGHPEAGRIWLDVNGSRRQEGDLNQMIWKLPEMIAYLSRYFTLGAGDLILTGTPAGVGPVIAGDVLEGGVGGVAELKLTVV